MTCQIFNLKVNYMDLQWVCLTQANWIQSSSLTFLIFKSGLNMIKFHKIKSYLTLLFLFIIFYLLWNQQFYLKIMPFVLQSVILFSLYD